MDPQELPPMNDPVAVDLSFEDSLLALERLVRELEDGRLGLDEALDRYERGVNLIKRCHNQLRQAEQRILQLTGVDENNQPLLQPFKHEATAVTKAEPLRRARKKGGNDDS
jgi:exodeoxyribonuclease VII small subunit